MRLLFPVSNCIARSSEVACSLRDTLEALACSRFIGLLGMGKVCVGAGDADAR